MTRKLCAMLTMACSVVSLAYAGDLPISYNKENTGAEFADPAFPSVSQLPTISKLPNPFEWSDGSGVISDFCEWSQRRNEIKREIEYYEIGEKPKFDNLTASLDGNTLTVKITNGSNTLTLTSKLVIPSGNGPHPIVIGMDGNTGSLSSSYFSKCIQLPFTHTQIAEYNSGFSGSRSQNDPFYKLYPGTFNTKADYCAWSWGISRLIDGLEIIQDKINADLSRIAVTGCSYAGKMALYAGAFDERIALTIAQESGGGGINSWRVSEQIGSSVEGISNTNYDWFLTSFKNNFNGKTSKIPYDHHELIAMIAPRAFLAFGNPDYEWLGDKSGFISLKAAEEVWMAMGIEDRFGYVIEGNHSHCQASNNQNQAAQKFINKFLYGNANEDTKIRKSTVSADYDSWKSAWAGHTLTIGDCGAQVEIDDSTGTETYWFEAEANTCIKIGDNFVISADDKASEGKYVVIQEGMNSTEAAPTSNDDMVKIPFSVEKDTTFHFHVRVNCASYPNDSYWIRVDDGEFTKYSGLGTNGEWQWFELFKLDLTAGNHVLTFAYREEGAKLDKVCITSRGKSPKGLGGEMNYCGDITSSNDIAFIEGYGLNPCYPNPVTEGNAEISFRIAQRESVSIRLYNALGIEIKELANEMFDAGSHTLSIDTNGLPSGMYYYIMHSENYNASQSLLIP